MLPRQIGREQVSAMTLKLNRETAIGAAGMLVEKADRSPDSEGASDDYSTPRLRTISTPGNGPGVLP